jgi:hypothetical protein
MLGLQISAWIFFLPGAMHGHCDFRHLYAAAYMVRVGDRGELYSYGAEQKFQDRLVSPEEIALPFNHLAYEALLFLPYSFASYRAGYFLFLLTNAVLLFFVIRLMRSRTCNLGAVFRWLPAALFITFLPVATAFMQGQDSIILLLFFTGGLFLLDKGEMFAPGFLAGLGLFKFQLVIPVAAMFFLWRKWRFVAGFATSSLLVICLSVWIAGPSQISTYAHSLLSMSVKETPLDQARFAIYPIGMPNLRGLIFVLTASFLSRFWLQALTAICSIVILLWTAVAARHGDVQRQFSIALTTAALLSYHLYIHDLSILLIPIVAALDQYLSGHKPGEWLTALAAIAMFAGPGIIGVTSIHPFIVSLPLIFLLIAQVMSVSQERQSTAPLPATVSV